jgi:ABC-type antimicrobial peptide transport system permease subunit
MKAIGGRNKDVSRIFTMEAAMIGLLGGLFGVGSGWLLGRLINLMVNYLATSVGGQSNNFFETPAWFSGAVIAFAFLVSAGAGVWPARRASKLNPLEALRYE